mgnify:CR=1 FL=1
MSDQEIIRLLKIVLLNTQQKPGAGKSHAFIIAAYMRDSGSEILEDIMISLMLRTAPNPK